MFLYIHIVLQRYSKRVENQFRVLANCFEECELTEASVILTLYLCPTRSGLLFITIAQILTIDYSLSIVF
jgi:hypothetical protein